MNTRADRLRAFLSGLRDAVAGTSAIEYAVIGSLISIAAAAVLLTVGSQVTALFQQIANSF